MRLRGVALAACVAGGYALYEPYRFRIAYRPVPVEAPAGLSILHLSDTHVTARRRALVRFLGELPGRLAGVPDIVVATGDLIENDSGIDALVEALAGIEARLGRFYVLGSHDYFTSSFINYAKYFTGNRALMRARPNDVARLKEGLEDKGWVALTNKAEVVEAGSHTVRVAGLDDPYLGRHRTGHVARAATDALAIGVVHTPDVVSEWALAGFDVVLAGHTHGGQVRIPGIGAVVTNCDLPAALAGGLHRIGRTWLHVSPGLGHGRLTPIRVACPPEATWLHLVPTRRSC